jgi:predicted ATPase
VIFKILSRDQYPPDDGVNEVYLRIDYWNDFDFVTMFDLIIFDGNSDKLEVGSVKIGFQGQKKGERTYQKLPDSFAGLPDGYFSLGQDLEYYKNLYDFTTAEYLRQILFNLKDVVSDPRNLDRARNEDVFSTSLMRSVSMSTIEGQYTRILEGGVPLSEYNFCFIKPDSDGTAGIELGFIVDPGSKPNTNIHAIIGRNGVGKTTLLNDMIAAIMSPSTQSRFCKVLGDSRRPIDKNYFSSLVSVAFSAFDPFTPPEDQHDPELGTRYYYIGLKDQSDESGTLLKSLSTMRKECVDSLAECFSSKGKLERWQAAITTLESDENFEKMRLGDLATLDKLKLNSVATSIVARMSSGHAIVLLIISRLIAKVEEKTLVLLDEPESHLHPPLLSAFTRALSLLLHNRNGVAIIATHSPVVLQEIPKSCAWVLTRSRAAMHAEPPRIETFGENVGVLTREVFGLEVMKSGFHSILQSEVNLNKSYDSILAEYEGKIGLEARGILRAMIAEKEVMERGA